MIDLAKKRVKEITKNLDSIPMQYVEQLDENYFIYGYVLRDIMHHINYYTDFKKMTMPVAKDIIIKGAAKGIIKYNTPNKQFVTYKFIDSIKLNDKKDYIFEAYLIKLKEND